MPDLWRLLQPFFFALLISALATPLAISIAHRAGVVKQPRDRDVHAVPTPEWGGIAIYLGFVLSLVIVLGTQSRSFGASLGDQRLLGILLGTTLAGLLGAADDRYHIPAKLKLLGQIACAAVLLLFGVRIEFLSNPFQGQVMITLHPWLGMGLTILWVVAITNAVNLIDGLDGLAAGVSAIACIAFTCLAVLSRQSLVAVMAACLAGGAIGFLPYNFNPARVFMGDLGSHLLGYALGALSVLGAFKVAASLALVLPVLALAVPIFDTAFAIARRARNGKPIFRADKDHTYHRLLARGLNQRQVVLIMYAISAAFAVIAYLIARRA